MTRLDAALAELADAIREEVRAELAEGADLPPELLSIDQAARRLGIGRTAAYGLMGRGELRSVKVGRRRLVPADALAAISNGSGGP
jgi:excisionase family DNA binding protein